MRCQLCRKKCGIPMDCNHCKGQFCIGCSNLEKHKCSGLRAKIEKDKETLSKQIAFEPPPKCLKI
jgi:predicted nucleic acid binding AN1-type Zn finger protein